MPKMILYVDPMQKDPREEKLPVWAAQALHRLRQRTLEAEAIAEEAKLATNPAESNTVLNPYGDTIGLGNDVSIEFRLPDPNHETHKIKMRARINRHGVLEISGQAALIMRSEASNVLTITADR